MEIIRKKEHTEDFWKYWNEFVTTHNAGPRYTRTMIEFYLELSESKGLLVSDECAVFMQDNHPVGVLFLPVEAKDEARSISSSLSYALAPLFTEEHVRKAMFEYVDTIAGQHKAQKIMFAIDALQFESYPYNFLLAHEYLDNSLLGYLIDLTLPGDLLRHLRRGHRSDIKTLLADPDFEEFMVTAEEPNRELHEGYREMHRIDAGRVTRSQASFDLQFKKLEDGEAVLFGLRHKKKIIAYSYYEMTGDKVLYFSAASDPEMTHFPLYHLLMWRAMNYFQSKGIRFIDVSQPVNPSMQYGYERDEKMRSISRFKRGFGGRYVNEFRGIKYFDQALYQSEAEQFNKAYVANIISGQEQPSEL